MHSSARSCDLFLSRFCDWRPGDPDQYEVSVLAEQLLRELQSEEVLLRTE